MSWMTPQQAAMSSLAQYMDLKKEDYKTLYYFAAQYFQIFDGIVFPSAKILQNVKNQDWIYYNMFDSRCILSWAKPHLRFQRRVLKQLIDEIESAVRALPDGEALTSVALDKEISDHLTEHLVYLQSIAETPEIERMQRKIVVTYLAPFYRPRNNQKEPFIHIPERPNLISYEGTTGTKTWPAALHLGTYLSREGRHLVTMKRVLELGAGTGLLSILCNLYEATFVLATDGTHKLVRDMYSDNVYPNHQHLTVLKDEDRAKNVNYAIKIPANPNAGTPELPLALQVAVLDWSDHDSLVHALRSNGLHSPSWVVDTLPPSPSNPRTDGIPFPVPISPPFPLPPLYSHPIDLILGADLIFEPASTTALVTTLADLITPTTATATGASAPVPSPPQAIIAASIRNLASMTLFEDLCQRHGMKVTEVEFRCPRVEDEEQIGLFHACELREGEGEKVRLMSVERAED